MKKFLAMGLAAMMMFAFTACGGDTTPSSSEAPEQEPSSAVETGGDDSVAEAGEDTSLQDVLDAGQLVMMTNATFPPYEYVQNTADGAVIVDGYTGVDVELCYLIAEKLGVELVVLDMNFDLLVDALASGKGDIVAAGMSITDERKLSVDFTVPYVDTTLSVIVPADSELTLDDLDGATISVQESTTSDLFVSDAEDFAPGEVLRFKSAVDAGNAVISGKADLAVIDEMTATNIVANSNGALMILDEPIGHEQYAMAVAKGATSLQDAVNEVLEQLVAEGKVDELIALHMEISKEG